MSDANGEPKSFGICEYEKVESTYKCIRMLNGYHLLDSELLVDYITSD